MIAYNIETRQFGWISNTWNNAKQGIRSAGKAISKPFQSNINNPNTKVNPVGNIKMDWKGGLNQAGQFGKNGATFNNRLGLTGKSTTQLTKGSLGDRIAWNRGGASKALGGNTKLTFGSKAKIGLTGVASGLAAGKIAGNIAQNRAQNQAVKAGLKPGTAEYDKFVKQKTQGAKTMGRIVGAAAGLAGARFLGRNTFKLVK